MSENKSRESWYKSRATMQLVGSLVTPLTVALVGVFGSQYLASRQDAETNIRLGAELMSHREAADSSLRKDMFNSIIANFLEPAKSRQSDQSVLQLELLACNFHESLDLAPLFKEVYNLINEGKDQEEKQRLLGRLEKVKRDLLNKQISVLEESGGKFDGTISIEDMEKSPAGVSVIDNSLVLKSVGGRDRPNESINVKVEALQFHRDQREAKFRVQLNSSSGVAADVGFWVGMFDLPMLSNIRLPQGNRCAIALREFTDDAVEITFIYFPGSRASLKEKPYYDEVIDELFRTRDRTSKWSLF
jgi:hypothetical protein